MVFEVLRLGHRIPRDERITTHCALVSRAFGVSGMYYTGMKSKNFQESVADIVSRFGGDFFVNYVSDGIKLIKKKKKEGWKIVHLTMYGIDYRKEIDDIKGDVLFIIGGEKVEGEYYELSDINIAVGNQPHSEVGALAIVLEKVGGIVDNFSGAKIKVNPCVRGKDIIKV